MRTSLPRLALGLATLLTGASARAQSMTMQTTCTGMLGMDPVGLAVPDQNQMLQSVAASSTGFVFNAAECQCATSDVELQIQLRPGALPQGTFSNNQLWVGTGCDNYTARSLASPQCEQIQTADLNATTFDIGSPQSSSGYVNIHIPAQALTSPRTHQCTMANASNSIYVFAITTDPTMPAGQCILNLTEQLTGPAPAMNVTAASGSSAVTLSWQAPSVGGITPYQYQILCADTCGNPVSGTGGKPGYSICVNGLMERRQDLPTASSLIAGTDGGVTGDGGAMSVPLGTEAAPAGDGGLSDGGGIVCPGVSMDGGISDAGLPVVYDPLSSIDHRFICSDPILATGASFMTRIGGLTNGQTYYFNVLAIDQFGNAVQSGTITGTATATEDLYGRYYNAGGRAHGFCFVATAAFGSYEDPFVQVLRDFRDEVLLPTGSGRTFVDWYYQHSPRYANYISEHRAARIFAQLLLWPIIGAAALWLYTGLFAKLLLLLAALAWVARFGWRRRLAWRRAS